MINILARFLVTFRIFNGTKIYHIELIAAEHANWLVAKQQESPTKGKLLLPLIQNKELLL